MLRKYNEAADALKKMASEWASIPLDVFTSDLHKPSDDYKEDDRTDDAPVGPILGSEASVPKLEAMDIEQVVHEPDDELDWRIPYLQCLVKETLLQNSTEAQWLARRAKTFVLPDGEMYKHSPSRILM